MPEICHIVPSLNPGGTERLVIEMSRRLKQTYSVRICCLDEPGRWASEAESYGIPVMALHRSPGFHPGLGLRIAKWLEGTTRPVLHCHHFSPFVYGRLAAYLRRGSTVLYTEHGRLSDVPSSGRRRVASFLLGRLPVRIFAVSGDLKDSLVEDGFPGDRIEVIHNGIEPGDRPSTEDRMAARRKLGIATDRVVVGTVARLNPVKDLETLIQAFALVRSRVPDPLLFLIGDGSERDRLEELSAALGVRSEVIFAGHRDDARSLLPAFDLFLNTSVSEGLSVTILEAMAAALPVVATSVGGTPELLVDTSVGLLVEKGQPQATAEAIERLLHDSAVREAMGPAARQRVIDSFSIARMIDRYTAIYEGVPT